MTRNIISILVIIASVGIFFGYIKPTYDTFGGLRAEAKQYDQTLAQADVIQKRVDDDQKAIKNIDPADMARIEKFLPDNVDNVNLIIDISNIASNFGLAVKNIDIKKTASKSDSATAATGGAGSSLYDSIDLSFSISASYQNFLTFIDALEDSLRLVDITSISFSPGEKSQLYNFNITIRTYWLK